MVIIEGLIKYITYILLLTSTCIKIVDCKLKFASLGNWGSGTKHQRNVAEKLKKVVADEHISFLISPGSNFEYGVSGLSDTKWDTAFGSVYKDESGVMDIPLFTVLGSGDWLGDFNSQINRAQQVYLSGQGGDANKDASTGKPRLIMPNWWYHYFTHFATNASISLLKSGHKDMSVGFIFIDTWILSNAFPFKDVNEAAWNELKKTLEIAPKILDYIIVVGDKPIQSSGPSKGDSHLAHFLLPLLKEANVDAYISGHDHDMELLDNNGLTLIVCGSSGNYGKRPVLKSSNSVFFSEVPGFCAHELSADGFTTKFVNGETGEILYTHTQEPKTRLQREFGNEIHHISNLPDVILHPIGNLGNITHKDTFTRIVGTVGLLIGAVHLVLALGTTLGKSAI